MPAVELEAGLIGLVVGAAASGSVQSYLARADRRRDARSAARLLYMQLHGAQGAVEDLLKLQSWDQMITDWDAYGAAWEKHSEALARVLNTTDFHTVSSAFSCIASLARSRAAATRAKEAPPPSGTTPTFAVNTTLYIIYRANVEAAKVIVFRVSFTWWEVRRRGYPDPA
jgi:hypothetical protein